MNVPGNLERLRFLVKTVLRESFHLRPTDERLFTLPLTPERSERMAVEWGARHVAIERATHRR